MKEEELLWDDIIWVESQEAFMDSLR